MKEELKELEKVDKMVNRGNIGILVVIIISFFVGVISSLMYSKKDFLIICMIPMFISLFVLFVIEWYCEDKKWKIYKNLFLKKSEPIKLKKRIINPNRKEIGERTYFARWEEDAIIVDVYCEGKLINQERYTVAKDFCFTYAMIELE